MASVPYLNKFKSGAHNSGSLTTIERQKSRYQSRHPMTMSSWYWKIAILMFLLSVEMSMANPIGSDRMKNLVYNFTCLEPGTHTVMMHKHFVNEPQLTPRGSLETLKNQLDYIHEMANKFTSTYVGDNEHDFITANTLPDLPTPKLKDRLDTKHREAFEEANKVVVSYLNELENIKLNMIINGTTMSPRFFNLSSIQTELEDWLHDLHRRMVQQQMTIDCDQIRQVLNKPYRSSNQNRDSMKNYLSIMMRKFTGVLKDFQDIFQTAIKNEEGSSSAESRVKKASELGHRHNRGLFAKRRRHRHPHRLQESSQPF